MKGEKRIKIVLFIVGIILAVVLVLLVVSKILTYRGNQSGEISEVNAKAICAQICEELSKGNTDITVDSKSDATVHMAVELAYDNPLNFWIDRDYQMISIGGRYTVRFSEYYSDHKKMLNEIDKAAEEILGGVASGSSDYELVKYVHDELCNRITYTDSDCEDDHNIYGALVKGQCVCEGYAKAFMYILSKAGIDSLYFSGTSVNAGETLPHAWNGVYLDGELYYFDLTWDDIESEYVSYSNFALDSTEILKNHSFDEYHPIIESRANKYSYYSYNGYILEEYSKENVAKIVGKQGNVIDIKCTSIVVYNNLVSAVKNPYQLNAILTIAHSENTGFMEYSYMLDDDTYCVRLFFE